MEKVIALENKGNEYQTGSVNFERRFEERFEESDKKTNYSLTDLELKLKNVVDKNTAKIEMLEKLYNRSEIQSTKFHTRLEELVNATNNNSDSMTKTREAELVKGMNELKNETKNIEDELFN